MAALIATSAVMANPEPRPPGPRQPPDLTKLSSMSLSPKEALDVNALSVDQVVSSLLGPHDDPVKPDPIVSKQGTIKMMASNFEAWLGDGSLDGDAVWAPVFESGQASKFTVPSMTCADLPPLFSVYGVLSPYAPIPYVGISTFTASSGAATTLSGAGGYGFVAPVNLTNPKTYGLSLSSMGKPYSGESAVWSMNCVTRELKATWTAADGSQVPLTFVAWSEDGLIATGNYDAWKKANPDTGAPLTLTFVPANSGSKTWFYPAHKQKLEMIKNGHGQSTTSNSPVKVVSPPKPAAAVVPSPAVNKPVAVAQQPQKQAAPAAAQSPQAQKPAVVAAPQKQPASVAQQQPAQKSAAPAQSKMARLVKR
ncbi:hypothetical protein OIO90_002897 [Microbotryomycetes sp. JL221]|nr:hypothetical protein OIO90_002897 [Microbotryomycetes sp. JL221]